MNNIKKQEIIKKNRLDEAAFFLSFMQEAYDKGLISDKKLEDIQIQGIQLLASKTKRFTSGDSSSIRVEVAQNIMNSIFYSISVYLKSLTHTDLILSEINSKTVSALYESGKNLVNEQFDSAKKLYKSVKLNCIKTENLSYRETLSGISDFFKSYDAQYAAHETPCFITYPLNISKINLTGVEYINSYLETLFLENEFCQNFSSENIHNLLHGYSADYKNLLINIFERVLTNSLGCIIVEKDVVQLNIEEWDLKHLIKKLEILPQKELHTLICKAEEHLFYTLKMSDNLKSYISKSIKEISIRLYNSIENNSIEKELINFNRNKIDAEFQFKDGTKMEDETFREIADEIRDCQYINDKIKIIKNSVHSIIDLIDILEGSCIFDEEFSKLFEFLENPELAMLIKLLPKDSENTKFEFVESEKEWHSKLTEFINKADSLRISKILELAEKISFS